MTAARCPQCGALISLRFAVHDCHPARPDTTHTQAYPPCRACPFTESHYPFCGRECGVQGLFVLTKTNTPRRSYAPHRPRPPIRFAKKPAAAHMPPDHTYHAKRRMSLKNSRGQNQNPKLQQPNKPIDQ